MPDNAENCTTCGPNGLKFSRHNGRGRIDVPQDFLADKLGSIDAQIAEGIAMAEKLAAARQRRDSTPATRPQPSYQQQAPSAPRRPTGNFTFDALTMTAETQQGAPSGESRRPTNNQFTLAETEHASLLGIGPPAGPPTTNQFTLAESGAADVFPALLQQEGVEKDESNGSTGNGNGPKPISDIPKDMIKEAREALLRMLGRWKKNADDGKPTFKRGVPIPLDDDTIIGHPGEQTKLVVSPDDCEGEDAYRRVRIGSTTQLDLEYWIAGGFARPDPSIEIAREDTATKALARAADDKSSEIWRECKKLAALFNAQASDISGEVAIEQMRKDISDHLSSSGLSGDVVMPVIAEQLSGITCPEPCTVHYQILSSSSRWHIDPKSFAAGCKEHVIDEYEVDVDEQESEEPFQKWTRKVKMQSVLVVFRLFVQVIWSVDVRVRIFCRSS